MTPPAAGGDGQAATETIAQALSRVIGSELSHDAKAAAFMAECIHRNYMDYAAVTQSVIEGYQCTIADLEAELAATRRAIRDACGHPWAPSADYILSCLSPLTREPPREGPP